MLVHTYHPQNEILNGVMNTAVTLAMAVIHTESAVFPLARAVMKFEILPPGHAATIIIPIATLGIGFKIKTNKKVKKGSATNWDRNPISTDFGAEKTRIKSFTRSLSATPSIMNPRLIFMNRILSSFILSTALSRSPSSPQGA